jgi:hypothetical protein
VGRLISKGSLRGLDMRRGTISFWFRVTSIAADLVRGRDVAYAGGDIPVLRNVVPLFMMGAQQLDQTPTFPTQYITTVPNDIADPPTQFFDIYGSWFTGKRAAYTEPTVIGVNVQDPDAPYLYFHLQCGNAPSCENTNEDTGPGFTPWYATGNGLGHRLGVFEYKDQSDKDQLLRYGAFTSTRGPEIELERAHHVMLSWDVTGGTSSRGLADGDPPDMSWERYTGYNKLYCALDDVNLGYNDLPLNEIDVRNPPSQNAILPDGVIKFATWPQSREGKQAHCSFTAASVPCDPIWIPGPAFLSRDNGAGGVVPLIDGNNLVEMGELQLFAGLTLDPSSTAIRRLFIDKEGKPVPPWRSEDGLGRKADIMLHKDFNWKKGRNTGALEGVQFDPVGDIERWDPELTLHGPQQPEPE